MKCVVAALFLLAFVALATASSFPLRPISKMHDTMAADLLRAKTHAKVLAGEQSSNMYVGGNIFPIGIYYTIVNIGTPALPFKVAIDTGSADLIIPSYGCKGCFATPSLYDSKNSTTSKPVMEGKRQKTFTNTYETCNLTAPTQPCTVSGPVWTDTFALPDGIAATVEFGAITLQTKNFQQFYVIDGVWGLAYTGVSGLGVPPPFQVLESEGLVANVFSMCLENNTGVLTIGGINSDYYTGTIGYTPLTCEGSYYCIDVGEVSVGSESTGILGQTIVDSGTNNILMTDKPWNAIKEAFLNNCTKSNLYGVCGGGKTLFDGECFEFTEEQIAEFPPISFALKDGPTVTATGRDYLLANPYEGQTGLCWGIGNTGSGGEALTIIGDALMQGYYVVFDRANNQMGWADVNLEACVSSAQTL